jgi:hypothetical protein
MIAMTAARMSLVFQMRASERDNERFPALSQGSQQQKLEGQAC